MKKQIAAAALTLSLLLCGCGVVGAETVTGWVAEAEGRTAYYTSSGEAVTGWQEIDGNTYYFDGDGYLCTGWLELDGKTYCLDGSGVLLTGWQEMDGVRRYFRADGSMATGWMYQDGSKYYFLPDGAMATGRQEIDGEIRIFAENGHLYTGYVDAQGEPCDAWAEGAELSSWVICQEDTYYLTAEGTLYTGWLEEGENLYYFQSDGRMAVGQVEIDGQTYHFNPHGVRVILVNPWNYLPEGYEVELTQYDELFSVATVCYDALMEMLDDCRAAGYDPTLVSGYRTQLSQEWLYENRIQRWMDQGYDREEATALAGTSVAIPGTSEHQLGLAVDLVDNSNRSLTEEQESTPAQQWLMAHCWEYGFILRYPTGSSDITGIIYEPWHYRYVGREIALELRDLGITLEEYLGAA